MRIDAQKTRASQLNRYIAMDQKTKRAKEIQNNIRDVLMQKWDPIGVSDVPEAQDEYDVYIGGIYRLLASKAKEKQIIEHLYKIETINNELKPSKKVLKEVVTALMKIDVNL